MTHPRKVSRRTALMAAAALGAAPHAPAFGQTRAGQERSPAPGITVIRDDWGTPHVYADTRRELFFGYGYSIAEDRLFQLDMARRSFTGRVAEVLGPDWIEHDRSVRSSADQGSIRSQYDALPHQERDIFEGYADGVNAHIDEVLADRESRLPKQYHDSGFDPSGWSGMDVVMIFVGTMAHRYSDGTQQLDNLATLRDLVARHGERTGKALFEQIVWRDDPKAPTTIPPSQPEEAGPAHFPLGIDPRQSELPVVAVAPNPRSATGPSMNPAEAMLAGFAAAGTGQQGPARFSNAWLIGGAKSASGGSILVNGPQFGFFQPAYTYSIGLHGAGFDLVGNTPFGYPAVLFGHNGDIAWGSTAGLGATVDLYAERLNPDDSREYSFDGAYRRMAERTEIIAVRGQEPVEITVRSTVHGPVIASDPDAGVAYSKKRSWAGYELDSLLGWIDSTRARSWPAWLAQAARNATTINWYYADRGNIGYVHTGKYPRRHPAADPRLPVPGTGEWEWRGLHPFSWNPKVFNPAQGYLANWNNKPAPGYEGSELWSSADRVREIDDLLRDRAELTPQQAWDIIRETSTVDVNARYFRHHLRDSVAPMPEGSREARAVRLLEEWNGSHVDSDGDGRHDHPGAAIMRAWLGRMIERTLAGDLPPATYQRFSDSGYLDSPADVASVNVGSGTRLVHNALLGPESGIAQHFDFFHGRDPLTVVREALSAALDDLEAAFGPDMAAWLPPVVPTLFDSRNFVGVPQSGADEAIERGTFLNRGSENNMIALEPAGVTAVEVAAPGQSGFVAPDGSTTRHYRDQLPLFFDFSHKPVRFTHHEVLGHHESIRRLR
ncbi:penicillin acylase family protein [Saccharopolyspora cebuensis]|uniref:Penicillin acylase family protein n=1 Tax=Saccharopolyspora cebuensis TaxID=418759 RepID=A0ABV4CJL7_9PSEU